jgi:hypothetical protein
LRIGVAGPGLECAASDVDFTAGELAYAVDEGYEDAYHAPVICVAEAMNGHTALFVDAKGRVFQSSLISGGFYYIGPEIFTALETLLLGRRVRPILKSTEDQVQAFGDIYRKGDPRLYTREV